jgi:hypothetical protein
MWAGVIFMVVATITYAASARAASLMFPIATAEDGWRRWVAYGTALVLSMCVGLVAFVAAIWAGM